MKASELIERLQRRIDTFWDWDVVFRDEGGELDPDVDIISVYADEEAERVVVSDAFDPFEE